MKTHFLRFACSRGFQRLALYPCKYSKIRSKKKTISFSICYSLFSACYLCFACCVLRINVVVLGSGCLLCMLEYKTGI
jgi:hypothetical protein